MRAHVLFVGRGLAPAACLKSYRLKPRPSGEVAVIADGEGCRDFRPLGCVGYLLFSGEEKRSKKVAGTLAAVSRIPQRSFGVSELINTRFLTVGTFVPGCPNRIAG